MKTITGILGPSLVISSWCETSCSVKGNNCKHSDAREKRPLCHTGGSSNTQSGPRGISFLRETEGRLSFPRKSLLPASNTAGSAKLWSSRFRFPFAINQGEMKVYIIGCWKCLGLTRNQIPSLVPLASTYPVTLALARVSVRKTCCSQLFNLEKKIRRQCQDKFITNKPIVSGSVGQPPCEDWDAVLNEKDKIPTHILFAYGGKSSKWMSGKIAESSKSMMNQSRVVFGVTWGLPSIGCKGRLGETCCLRGKKSKSCQDTLEMTTLDILQPKSFT